jgi:pathogenesis-related protein 1
MFARPYPKISCQKTRFGLIRTAIGFLLLALPQATAAEPPQLRSASVSILQSSERDRFVAAHNAARAAVAVDSLTWSDELAAEALESLQQQRETLIRQADEGWTAGHIPLPVHRTDHTYGENIAAWAGTGPLSAERAVALWLREKPAFNLLNSLDSYRVGDELPSAAAPAAENAHIKPSSPLIVGHYTQIVWRSTGRLGAAQLTFDLVDDQGTTRHYVALICNYDPPGNRLGEKPY